MILSRCPQIPYLWFLAVTVLLMMLLVHGVASSSQYNYNPYLYDMTVPQFTPDGRLLQVEYATAAADHSSPIVAVRLNTDSDDDDSIIVLACRRTSLRNRLVVLPQLPSTGSQATPPVILALSGVLADSGAIVRRLQQHLLGDMRTHYGCTTASRTTPWATARILARICQEHTMAGGMRVYGATAWVGGWVRNAGEGSSCWTMYQTDPSGAAHPVEWNSGDDAVATVGGGDAGRVLQRLISKKVLGNYKNSPPCKRIQAILRAVVGPDGGDAEVVLVSASRGVIQLTPDQVQQYLNADE